MATGEMLEADILDLLKVARDKNSPLKLTGLLVYQKRTNEFFSDFRRIEESYF